MTDWIECDAPCPQRAVVHVLIKGMPLHFCGHHGDKYRNGLLDAADSLTDDRMTVYR